VYCWFCKRNSDLTTISTFMSCRLCHFDHEDTFKCHDLYMYSHACGTHIWHVKMKSSRVKVELCPACRIAFSRRFLARRSPTWCKHSLLPAITSQQPTDHPRLRNQRSSTLGALPHTPAAYDWALDLLPLQVHLLTTEPLTQKENTPAGWTRMSLPSMWAPVATSSPSLCPRQ
jgi:hypothetical protein